MYERLETKEGEHDIFKIAKVRERRRKDTEVVKFIKGEDGRVLGEVRVAVRKMGRAKAVGPDNIPIEAWKSLGKEGVQWLTDLVIASFALSNFSTGGKSSENFNKWRLKLSKSRNSRSIQETVPWCMLFADDIVLVAETKQCLNERLEEWRAALEGKGLRISSSKTEYLYCDFSEAGDIDDTQITIDGQMVLQTTKFKYLGSFVQSDGEIYSDVIHRIQVGWCRWRVATGVLCDKRFPTKLKGKFYRVVVRHAMLYGTDWAIKKRQTRKMEVAEIC
ncbi:uncharacterized protein LOC110866860 [Helianthus annuus]|uniref:uncharacterized protein LOC110866860 n=1 Tax=Helianthus annuus TaxID=4232 RepID=UPI000B8F3AA7|nr:uncharacterized protein LOC110866860 [Helianthus annuus]